MADREKVIKGLEHCRQYGTLCGKDCSGVFSYTDNLENIVKIGEHRHDCQYGKCKTGCVVTLVDDAIAMLKEQEPILLENQHKPYGISTNANSPWISRCPKCGKKVEGKQTRFCKYCGQAVKWDD